MTACLLPLLSAAALLPAFAQNTPNSAADTKPELTAIPGKTQVEEGTTASVTIKSGNDKIKWADYEATLKSPDDIPIDRDVSEREGSCQ